MNYTAMGDCVNVAKRLQETARGGQVLMDAKSYDLVRGQVRVNPIGPVTLKGRAAPEVAFELVGM
jgi:class 3 adenylate cyclase